MKRYNKKGATSILIIFMMIVLVTIGAFTIVSSNLNYSFSKKVSNWNKDYYALEKNAEYFLQELDNNLIMAKNDAIKNISESDIDKKHIKTKLNEYYSENVVNNLNALRLAYPNLDVKFDENSDLLVDVILQLEDQNFYMNLLLNVNTDVFTNNKLDKNIIEVKNDDADRFEILKRNQWQYKDTENKENQLWDGNIE